LIFVTGDIWQGCPPLYGGAGREWIWGGWCRLDHQTTEGQASPLSNYY